MAGVEFRDMLASSPLWPLKIAQANQSATGCRQFVRRTCASLYKIFD